MAFSMHVRKYIRTHMYFSEGDDDWRQNTSTCTHNNRAHACLQEVMMIGGKMSEEDAAAALSSYKMDGRYTVEAWS
jgi:hypothetical protein